MVLPKFPPLGRLIWTLEPPGLKARLEDCLATGQLVDSGKGVTAPLPSNGNGSLGRQEEQLQVKRKHKGAMAVRSCQGVLQDSDDSACYTSSLCRFEAMDSTCQVECLSDRDLPDSPRSCVYSIRTGVPHVGSRSDFKHFPTVSNTFLVMTSLKVGYSWQRLRPCVTSSVHGRGECLDYEPRFCDSR